MVRKKRKKIVLKTTKGDLEGVSKQGKMLALVFRKKGKLVLGSKRFKNRTSLKKFVRKIVK